MPTLIPDTAYNRELAASVHERMAEDTAYVRSMRWRALAQTGGIWLIGGAAVLLGIAACIYAYGTYVDPRTSMDKMSLALADALSKTTLKTDGEVKLQADALRLDTSGTTIGLDTKGARVAVEPGRVTLDTSNAKVSLDPAASGGSFQPSSRQLGAGGAGSQTVTTSFTVFQTQAYMGGQVTTGWKYKPGSSTTDAPDAQYCYFSQSTGDGTTDVKVDVAQDRRIIEKPNRIGLDVEAAARNCVWYNG